VLREESSDVLRGEELLLSLHRDAARRGAGLLTVRNENLWVEEAAHGETRGGGTEEEAEEGGADFHSPEVRRADSDLVSPQRVCSVIASAVGLRGAAL
jgi:hypothetical protein